ncbi:RNA polymerase I-associated factor PAF67-domain-containing protein [Boletus reticuloceps]|uniref:Eukaryotic translation initiation factor 3 subunit L n=1 Tax=Boletus reticuloceps TaxID=495285 RepID=A0A8I2YSW4_9AGAM|nr:RNA polymerase I-associated factor PAF67-domain-containing protein [Boletus reticuloceps]
MGITFQTCPSVAHPKEIIVEHIPHAQKMSTQQRVPLWAAEPDLDDEINDVDIPLTIPSYPAADIYDDPANLQLDESALLAMQAQIAQQTAFSQIPDVVKRFIVHFHQAVLDNNLPEITLAYESGWNRLTEKFYAKTEWPEAEIIAPLVNDDQIFLVLYRELYYRHVYSRLQPNIDDRFHSYENSCELFNYLLNSEGPVPLSLPAQWLWDIIDEFIYQFQSFALFRSRPATKTDDELTMLASEGGAQAWSSYSVLNVLYSLIQKSHVNEWLKARAEGKTDEEIEHIAGEYGTRPLYRQLGYFSLIGLLRVHVLLGDFTLALKIMEQVGLGLGVGQKAPFTAPTAAHVSTAYHAGVCYLMLRRVTDAARVFTGCLNWVMRARQYHMRSYQYDQINKTADRMYALLALCNTLAPTRLDDNVMNIVRERYGDQLARMGRGEEGLSTFEEIFLYACPKFITANGPPYNDRTTLALLLNPPTPSSPSSPSAQNNPTSDPTHRHMRAITAHFLSLTPVPVLRSLLKLYTSLDSRKLAGFLDAGVDEEEVLSWMMVMKNAGRSIGRVNIATGADKDEEKGTSGPSSSNGAGSVLDGEWMSISDLNFVIDENMIHIAESTVGRRYAGWFIRNSEYAARVLDGLRASPLPGLLVPTKAQNKEGEVKGDKNIKGDATTTLTLLLERQRLQSTHPTLHLAQIVTNLRTFRSGVITLQDASDVESGFADGGRDDGVVALREQYERLRGMLGEEEAEKAGLASIVPLEVPSPTLPPTPQRKHSLSPAFEPYTDEPFESDPESDAHALREGDILLQQRHIVQDQDTRLDHLSSSIYRQHHISLQINDELEVHTGLLGALDTELDGTQAHMAGARRRLTRVARGAKENGSTVTIGLLILVLLVLIVVFKT